MNITTTSLHSDSNRAFWPALYFGAIVVSNVMMVWLPMVTILGVDIPPAIFLFGFVFALRDFAQRRLGHHVLGVMVAAAIVTYWLAGPGIALASTTAFMMSELADWAVYTITKRPFVQRMLVSSLVSVPVDTAVFFLALGILDAKSLVVGIAIKMIGTGCLWAFLVARPISDEQPA